MWSAQVTTNVMRTIKATRTPTIKNTHKTKRFSETHTETQRVRQERESLFCHSILVGSVRGRDDVIRFIIRLINPSVNLSP